MSKKILDLARDQQEEIAKEVGQSWADEDDDEPQGEPYVLLNSMRGHGADELDQEDQDKSSPIRTRKRKLMREASFQVERIWMPNS